LMLAHHQIKKRRQNPMLIEAHGRTYSRQRPKRVATRAVSQTSSGCWRNGVIQNAR
jgi:hypothetical protein